MYLTKIIPFLIFSAVQFFVTTMQTELRETNLPINIQFAEGIQRLCFQKIFNNGIKIFINYIFNNNNRTTTFNASF